MTIDPNNPTPLFRQIGDYVRKAVASGRYRPGEAIPSLRTMALELHVNPNTVKRAYEDLERSGLIQGKAGVGMFVTLAGAREAKAEVEGMVYDCFMEGLRIAQGSGIDGGRARELFERAWAEDARRVG